jgi:dTDP-4-amino-4,6-dideoxy-D-galactose acyltransferase
MRIKLLAWDSRFFGFPIAHADPPRREADIRAIDAFAAKHGILLVQCCVDVRRTETIALLESGRFHFVDLKMTYSAHLPDVKIRKSRAVAAAHADIPILKKIAADSFTESRYNAFPFDRAGAARLFGLWVEKAVRRTRDDTCLKIERSGTPVGFATARSTHRPARVGLVALKKGYRSRGLGRELMHALFRRLLEKKISDLEVVTQGRNIAAQNFYHQNGFALSNIQAWFYKTYP